MVTIREYYDLFLKYAPDKSEADFVEQATLVGYTEQEVNDVLGIKTAAPTPVPDNLPVKQEEHPLPAIILRPSSYVSRNQIGFQPLAGPAKSFKYGIKSEIKTVTPPTPPVILPSTPLPVSVPIPTPRFTTPTTPPRIAPLKSTAPSIVEPLVTMASQTQNQILNPILNPKTTNVTGVINRSPIGIPTGKRSAGMSSGMSGVSKFMLVILILIILGGGGFVAYTWLNNDTNKISDRISGLVGNNKPPYTSANALSSILDKISSQNSVPYLATFSTKIQDKEPSVNAFIPSPYERDPAYARDQRRREDGYKAKEMVDNFYTTKKRYPKTLAEAGFTTLDPVGKPYGYALTSSTTIVTAATKGKPAVTKVVPGYRITVNFESGPELPFSDYYNDLLTFAAKIDLLPKKLAIDSNLNGEFNKSTTANGDNSLTIKGQLVINSASVSGTDKKPIDLQFVNHSGSFSAKSNYSNRWIDLAALQTSTQQVGSPSSNNLFGLIGKILHDSVSQAQTGSAIWKVAEPVTDNVVLSSQISMQAYRYNISLTSDTIAIKNYLNSLKGNINNSKFDYIVNHKDIDKILNYINSATTASLWVDQKGQPIKFQITAKLGGRVSARELNTLVDIEFGQANPATSFVIPNDLVAATQANLVVGSTSSSTIIKLNSLSKDINLLIPASAIMDAINSLKNAELGSVNSGLGASAIGSLRASDSVKVLPKSKPATTKKPVKPVKPVVKSSTSKPQIERNGKTMYLYQ